MKIKGAYIVLLLVTMTFLGTLSYQYHKAGKIQDAQETALKMQGLLESVDLFSSNLGSIQQYFRNYVASPSSTTRSNILFHQMKVDSALATMKTLGVVGQNLKALTMKMGASYMVERDKILTYISNPINSEIKVSKVVTDSEAHMAVVWTSLFDYRKLIKQSVIEKSNAVALLSAKSKNMALNSIFLLIALVLVIISIFYSNRKQHLLHENKLMEKDRQCSLMGSLLDNTTTSMHIVDKEGKILYFNKAFLNFIGLPPEAVFLKTFKEIPRQRSITFAQPELRESHLLDPFECDETIEIDEQPHYFFTRKYPVKNAEGEIFAAAIISRDITDRILNEQRLEISRQEAEHARLTQEQFMANISHEIRTPMNGIMGMTDLLSETPLHPEQRDYLDTIKQSSINLMALINDILDFSKIEAGMLQLEEVPFKVSAVIEQSLNSLKVKASQKNIYLDCNIDHKVPAALVGDPLRLYQIISNLLSNAIKFTTDGGVSLALSACISKTSAVTLTVKITDTGMGIPEERINYIFQSFAQTSLDISRKFGGTGLGLTIVKQLVELQGGSITVESKLGVGSCFTVNVPFQTSMPESWTQEETAKFALLKGKEVLVVEDNLINQKVIVRTLENAGVITTVVDNGFSAMDILKSRSFDTVIMDIQMPEIDGRETTMKIRDDLKLGLPIIAMTASVSADERERCIAAGMNDYIAKPFVKEHLFEKLLLHVAP